MTPLNNILKETLEQTIPELKNSGNSTGPAAEFAKEVIKPITQETTKITQENQTNKENELIEGIQNEFWEEYKQLNELDRRKKVSELPLVQGNAKIIAKGLKCSNEIGLQIVASMLQTYIDDAINTFKNRSV